MSPPPRLEADDYMSVHSFSHHHHKRKHPGKIPRRHYNTREGSDESRPPQRSLKSGPQTASLDCSDSAGVSEGDAGSTSNTPLIGSLSRPYSRNHRHGRQDTTGVDRIHAQTWPTLNLSAIAVDEPDSPAVNALQSISAKVPKVSNSQGLQRVSTVLANTINLLRPNPTVSFANAPSHKASKKAEEASRRSSAHSQSLAYRDINHRRPTIKDSRDVGRTLGTPATITLRKASNVYATGPITTSMSASLTREELHKRAVNTPASELLAFYSSSTPERSPPRSDQSSPGSADGPKSLMEQPKPPFEIEAQSFRRQSKSISQFSNTPNARRCSMPAEAALTFADVHVAPGSFAVEPNSERQPLVPTEFSRRISTVQFRSRNSVHEVIWREDETTSDSSLTASSGASQHVGHTFRSTPSPEGEGTSIQEPAMTSEETKSGFPGVTEPVSNLTRMPDNLFRWAWGSSAASVEGTPRAVCSKSDPLDQVAVATAQAADTRGDPFGQVPVISLSDPGFTSLQLSDQQSSRSFRTSFSKLPSAQCFPPYFPSSPPAVLRKPTVVDLSDPLAARVAQYPVQTNAHSTGQEADVGNCSKVSEEGQSLQIHGAGGRRWSSGPHAVARPGPVSRVGSSIGTSSRKRISHKI